MANPNMHASRAGRDLIDSWRNQPLPGWDERKIDVIPRGTAVEHGLMAALEVRLHKIGNMGV